jgi:hypothetical protein
MMMATMIAAPAHMATRTSLLLGIPLHFTAGSVIPGDLA